MFGGSFNALGTESYLMIGTDWANACTLHSTSKTVGQRFMIASL
jgi:hypothetical protein